MGSLRFRLPTVPSAEASRDLQRAYVAGGYDNMPTPTRTLLDNQTLTLQRETEESGYAQIPWRTPGVGAVMSTTATLLDRGTPHDLLIELARGKVNQVRCQAADWKSLGFEFSADLDDKIRAAGTATGHAIANSSSNDSNRDAQTALLEGYRVAQLLVDEYSDQIIAARKSRLSPLDTLLGVRINGSIPPAASNPIKEAFNSIAAPIAWRAIEPSESHYRWERTDAVIDWAEKNEIGVSAGPLIDFSARGLPDWLWLWEGDLQSLSSFMCDFVETAVGRYRDRIRRWQLTTAGNVVSVLKLGEDDLLWLTARLAEAAWQIDPDLELVVGLSQPWGEYMARTEYTYSPFLFADTLIRAGLRLAAIDLEWIMGVDPRGTYHRDPLDASRLLDLYALLGIPLQITMASPADYLPDTLADPTQAVSAGFWREDPCPTAQADWARTFTKIAVSKPFVRSIYWAQLTDAEDHAFPHCGLFDPAGQPRPCVETLQTIRKLHLR